MLDKYTKIRAILVEKLKVDKKHVLALVFSVFLSTLLFMDSTYFGSSLLLTLWIVIAIGIVLLLSWLFIQAGFTVLKSLFLMGAELSLLIFLAQSYCDVKMTASPSDGALRSLMFLSVVYMLYEFFKSLKELLKKRLDNLSEKRWTKEKILVVVLFLFFTGSVMWAIYQVVSPIILDICVLKR